MSADLRPFSVPVDQVALDDLTRRLSDVRWPDDLPVSPGGDGWEHGTQLAYLRELVDYWRDEFDWAAQAATLDSVLPSSLATVDGLEMHVAVLKGQGPKPFPLTLLHGWPSSYAEMMELAQRLSNPGEYGGDPDDAFDVMVPSLPGHGFSQTPTSPDFGTDHAAAVVRSLMVDVLGYERFGAHGGDRGAFVCAGLGHDHRDVVSGIHVTFPIGLAASPPTEEDQLMVADQMRYFSEEGGYIAEQSTRPMTLAYGLHDSPVGMLAWLLEKFRAWSDCGGDVESRFSKDQILTNATIYWLTGTMRSSMHYYRPHRLAPPAASRPVRIDCPTGVASFPHEVIQVPRSAAERKYDLRWWTDMPTGGHFAQMEEPVALADDITAFFLAIR